MSEHGALRSDHWGVGAIAEHDGTEGEVTAVDPESDPSRVELALPAETVVVTAADISIVQSPWEADDE